MSGDEGPMSTEPNTAVASFVNPPKPDRCGDCGEATVDTAVCSPCAWNRYYDQLDEWWDRNPLGGDE